MRILLTISTTPDAKDVANERNIEEVEKMKLG